MEALRESFLHLTFQMSTYKRATLDEEELVDSTSDDVYGSSPMQVKAQNCFRSKSVIIFTAVLSVPFNPSYSRKRYIFK